jgi:hypothetical protein
LCHIGHKVKTINSLQGKIMGKADTTMAKSTTGATAPKGATSSDRSGERMEKTRGGVAMGMEDKTGSDKQFNTGRTEGICYTKTKSEYR